MPIQLRAVNIQGFTGPFGRWIRIPWIVLPMIQEVRGLKFGIKNTYPDEGTYKYAVSAIFLTPSYQAGLQELY